MITADDIHSFYNRYNENNRLLDEKEQELLNDRSDLTSWVGLLRERSALARKIYLENAKAIKETIEPFLNDPSLLTDETVRAFLEETALIVGKDYPDYEITEAILSSIINYMEKNGYPSFEIANAKNSLRLSQVLIKQPLRSLRGFPELDTFIRYVDENLGTESSIHTQNLVMILTIRKRIQTYIHSIIVSKLATLIARTMIAACSDYFSCAGRAQADILGFISTSALVHDIGKTDMAHIIDTEERDLTPDEFEIIKTHPEIGGEFLESVPSLAKFADIARGHHVHFNGQGGYPSGFDINGSKYKNVISLVSICDAIDAGTDDIGRNYTVAKPLSSVLDEIIEERGTRYDPVITDAILCNDSLIEQIGNVISVGRENVCYDIYHRFAKEQST